MRRSCFALTASLALALALAVPVFAAPPAIDEIFAERDTDNLSIWWKPPAGTFTGYRVYKSTNVDCSPDSLVYEGTATSYVDAGALVDSTLALYRVQTYDGTATGPLTLPVYKYELVIPPPGAFLNGRLVTLPWYAEDSPPPFLSALDECVELNGALGQTIPVAGLARWNADFGYTQQKWCINASWPVFDMEPQQAFILYAGGAVEQRRIVFGLSQPDWHIDFPIALIVLPETPPVYRNLYHVALPYDHDYVDLADVALDIPEALEVRIWDIDITEENQYGTGLSRVDSASPWVGTNYTLDDRRGDGLIIAVETPTSWTPRRRCIGTKSSTAPARVNPLLATKAGADVDLSWPADPHAEGGYDVWRVATKVEIPTVLGLPVTIDVTGPTPAFPVVDPLAITLPSIHFYQVVGRATDGTPGAL